MGGQATGAGGLLRFAQKLPFYLLSPVEGNANHTYHCSQFQNVLYRVEFTYFMVVSVVLCETYVAGARSVLFCATDQQVQDYARALRGVSYPLAPYLGSDCKPCSVAREVHDMDKAQLVWQETLRLVGMSVECVEVAVSESDPPDVAGDLKYMDSIPAVGNGEDFEFLLENGDDADDLFNNGDS
jgi:hypothetical protein